MALATFAANSKTYRMRFVLLFILANLSSIKAQSISTDQALIQNILNDQDLAAYAMTCRQSSNNTYGRLFFSKGAYSIECAQKGFGTNLETINAKPILSKSQVDPLFARARDYFEEHPNYIYQVNQMLLDSKVYLLVYYYESKPGNASRSILFY